MWIRDALLAKLSLLVSLLLATTFMGCANLSNINSVLIKPDIHVEISGREILHAPLSDYILYGPVVGLLSEGLGVRYNKQVGKNIPIIDAIDKIITDAVVDAVYSSFVDGLNNAGVFFISHEEYPSSDAQLIIIVHNDTYAPNMKNKNLVYDNRTPYLDITAYLVKNTPLSWSYNDSTFTHGNLYVKDPEAHRIIWVGSDNNEALNKHPHLGTLPIFDAKEYESEKERVQHAYKAAASEIVNNIIRELVKDLGKD